jgi:hypothetical protein
MGEMRGMEWPKVDFEQPRNFGEELSIQIVQ